MLYTFGSITVVPWSINVGHTVLIDLTQHRVSLCTSLCALFVYRFQVLSNQLNHRIILDLLTFISTGRSKKTHYYHRKKLLSLLFLTWTTVYRTLQSNCTSRYFDLERRLISGLSAQWVEPIKSPISKHFVVTQRSNWRCILIIESLDCFLD